MHQSEKDQVLRVPLMASYTYVKELSVSSVFGLSAQELELFFRREHIEKPQNKGEVRECLKVLEKVGNYKGLIEKLATDANTGIIGDRQDIELR